MGTKICTKCKVEKPFNDYYKHKNGKDGLNPVCKLCWKEENKMFEQNNPRYEYRSKRYQSIKTEHNKAVIKRTKERYNNDIEFKLLSNIRSRILKAIKGYTKSKTTKELLGIDIEQYKIYLESKFKEGMDWNNHGSVWEIDHIMPCDSFDMLDPKQQKQCFHYTNTQPLFKIQNRIKSNKML